MPKIGLLTYHKNAEKLYPQQWIDEYRHSILNQTYKDFAIHEMNYGGDKFRIFENSYFESVPMPTFVHALNYLMDKCFSSGYDYLFNSNVDDTQTLDRIEKQLPYLEQGYDIVSSNFALVENGQVTKYHKFDKLNIQEELDQDNNIICHPSVGYSKWLWRHHRYNPDEQPREDLLLWKRAIKDMKFIILPDNLVYHRIHDQSVCNSENR